MRDICVLIASMRSSSNLGIGELIKNNQAGRGVKVFHVGSINEMYMPASFFQDGYEFGPQPGTDTYLEYLARFCRNNKIDVVFPRDTRILSMSAAKQLEDCGVRVIRQQSCTNPEVFDDKHAFYQIAASIGLLVPQYRVVCSLADFIAAVKEIEDNGKIPCFKPRTGIGGRGFRIIREYNELDNLLTGYAGASITFENAVRIFSQQETFSDLLVMEYLDGVEYSIDCLSWQGNPFVVVPRRKVEYAQMGSYSVQRLEKNAEIVNLAETIISHFQLDYISNVQIRYSGERPYLLEVNPRASGGINISCLSGVNFPYAAVQLALGEKMDINKPELDRLVVKQSNEFLL